MNVIIIVVDGRRNYHSDDISTKLDFMDEFGKESVEFETAVCSAPSSAMSMSAILSSVPSYYLSKDFTNFTFRGNSIPSINRILKGYSNYGISVSFGEFFREIMEEE